MRSIRWILALVVILVASGLTPYPFDATPAKATGPRAAALAQQSRITPITTSRSCVPATSGGATINFDDLAAGTAVVDQYGTLGVHFVKDANTTPIVYGNTTERTSSSDPNSLANNANFPVTSSGVPLTITFDSPQTTVGFYLGNGDPRNPPGAVLRAFDVAGVFLGSAALTVTTNNLTLFLGVTDSAGGIRMLTLDYGATSLSEEIDDLCFTKTVAQPTLTPIPTATATITPTATATVTPTATATVTPTSVSTATATATPQGAAATSTPPANATATTTPQQAPATATPTPATAATPTFTPQTGPPTATATPTKTPVGPTPTATPTPPIFAVPYRPPLVGVLVPFIAQDLSIHGIEITQGIQCFNTSQGLASCPDNSLPVVTKKDTAARIYLKYTSAIATTRDNVPVRLHIRANDVWYTSDVTGKAKTTLSQVNADDSTNVYFVVNFSNAVTVDFYAEVDPENTISETDETNNRYPASGYITLNFQPRRTLTIVGQRLRYHPSGYSGEQYAGGWAVNGGGADWLEQLLPIRNDGINYTLKSGYLNWTTSLGTGDGQHALISYLNLQWILENAFSWLFGSGAFTGASHVYGWAPNAGYSGGHADMPVYPHAGGLGVVGIGSDSPGTSTDSPGRGGYIFGHELVHDYNVYHTDTGADDCGSDDSSSDFPYSTSSIQEFGFNPTTGKIYNPSNTHDLMSYCPSQGSKEGWISPFTWNRMFSRLSTTSSSSIVSQLGASSAATRGVFSLAQTGESLIVNATILRAGGGHLGQLHRIGAGITYTLPSGDYAIELRIGSTVLRRQTFAVSFQSEYTEGELAAPASEMVVSMVIPWEPGTTSVVLLNQNTVLDQRAVSSNAPTVRITSPTAAVSWTAGTTQTVSWSGSDPDGDSLAYSVFYSTTRSTSWELLASGYVSESIAIEVDALRGATDARFRVVATDGVNTGYDETAPIAVPNKPPIVIITNPVSNTRVAQGVLVVLRGQALDMEDGQLADAALRWSSDRQGDLGAGSTVPLTTLQPGQHVITLNATDSSGATSSATVTVLVDATKIYLPVVLAAMSSPSGW